MDRSGYESKDRYAIPWSLITRLEVGRKIMNDFIEAMDEVAIVEKKPSMEGNTMSTVLAPKKK